jgi:hypothetical protein
MGPRVTIGSRHDRCVVSLGINAPGPANHPEILYQDFPRGIARLSQGLLVHGYDGDMMAWEHEYPAGSPSVRDGRCAFKPFCFREAGQRGYRTVLWCDSSIVVRRSIEPLLESIERDGYLLFQERHSVGEYCKDEALATLGITREESFSIPSCWACVLGLDLSNVTSRRFLEEWTRLASGGVTFPGPKWSGIRGWPRTASADPRVKGHRSDQNAASVLAMRLGMSEWKTRDMFFDFFHNDRLLVRRLREDIPSADEPRG